MTILTMLLLKKKMCLILTLAYKKFEILLPRTVTEHPSIVTILSEALADFVSLGTQLNSRISLICDCGISV